MSKQLEFDIIIIHRDLQDLGKQLHIYLAHFPKHEKYSMVRKILDSYYEILDSVIEFELKYYKKTSGNQLHTTLERLKRQILLCHSLGLFNFHNKFIEDPLKNYPKGNHRYEVLSLMVSELSEKIVASLCSIKV